MFGGFFGAHPCLIGSGIDQFYWNQTFKSHCLEAVLLHQYFVADNAGCPFGENLRAFEPSAYPTTFSLG